MLLGRGVRTGCALAALVCPLVIASASAAETKESRSKIDGFWDAPGGRIAMKNKNGRVVGVVTSAADGVGIKVGEKVLEGSLDEDNMTGDLRLGLVAPACGSNEGTAFVVLLLTRSGKLTGGVSARVPCAAGTSSLTLTRASTATGALAAVIASSDYDAQGKRSAPVLDSVKDLLTDGKQYLDEGQFEKAREQFQKAVTKDPSIGEGYNGVGVTYAARNDYESAIEWYKRGLEATPGFGDLYYNLACAYSQQTKPALALRYLKLAATKGYTEFQNLEEDHDFDPIRSDPEFQVIRQMMRPASPKADPATAVPPGSATAHGPTQPGSP
jgi:hypothetical protein